MPKGKPMGALLSAMAGLSLILFSLGAARAFAVEPSPCTIYYPQVAPRSALRRRVSGYGNLLTGTSPFSGTIPTASVGWGKMARLVLGNKLDPANILLALHEKYGSHAYSILPSGDPILFVSDPKVIDAILRETRTGTQHGVMERDPLQAAGGLRVFGPDTIMTGNGDGWKEQRDLFRPYTKRSAVESPENYGKMVDTIDRRVAELRKRIGDGKEVDMQGEFHKILIEMQLRSFFHTELSSKEVDEEIAPALLDAGKWLMMDTALNKTPFNFLKLPTVFPAQARAKKAFEKIYQLVDRIIQEHLDHPRGDIVDEMLAKENGDRERTRQLIALIVVASTDVTVSYGTWPLDAIARNPDVAKKLAANLQQNIGNRTLAPTDKVPYLDGLLNETLRFYTPFYFLMRRAPKDMVIQKSDGTHLRVPAGTHMVFSTIASHRREAEWGVEATGYPADKFVADRWLPENPKQANDKNLCAFGAGAHHCPGMVVAKAEVRLLLASFVQNFDFAPVSSKPTVMTSQVVTQPLGGLPLWVTPKPIPPLQLARPPR